MVVGERIIFWGYGDEIGSNDPIFRPGDFGVVVGQDGDAVTCLLTDERGKVLWWRADTLFAEEFIPLGYTPRIPAERLPVPYGTMTREPR